MLVYCLNANFNVETDKLSIQDIHNNCTNATVIDDKKAEIVIIAFLDIHISKLICENNILLISPQLTTDKDTLVDLSCHHAARVRSPNRNETGFYGLPGFPGFPGYNLAILTDPKIQFLGQFKSVGGRGGIGQKGTPPGKCGIGGSRGSLIINKVIIEKGQKGRDAEEHVSTIPCNSYGILQPTRNEFGIVSNIESYEQIIYHGISQLEVERNTLLQNFFHIL